MKYDLIIVGAGPAGLTAAIYAARYKLNVVVIGKETGGLAATAHKVWNYPSHKEISGMELMKRMVEHVKSLEVEIINADVLKVSGKDGGFVVKTRSKEYKCKKIIYASGTVKSELGVKGEKEFVGKGVNYCATCDAGFYKGKVVGVVGGSNSALSSALLLTEYASKVYIIYRKGEFFRADPSWIERVEKNKKIEVLFNEEIVEIYGSKIVEGVKLKSGKNLQLGGLFIEIGGAPHTYVLDGLGIKTDKKGYIITDKSCRTSVQGIYAAGDVTDGVLKQIVTAAGEGAVASFGVFMELRKG